jgi:hypothetical protein
MYWAMMSPHESKTDIHWVPCKLSFLDILSSMYSSEFVQSALTLGLWGAISF